VIPALVHLARRTAKCWTTAIISAINQLFMVTLSMVIQQELKFRDKLPIPSPIEKGIAI